MESAGRKSHWKFLLVSAGVSELGGGLGVSELGGGLGVRELGGGLGVRELGGGTDCQPLAARDREGSCRI